jgi:hypothetical protein
MEGMAICARPTCFDRTLSNILPQGHRMLQGLRDVEDSDKKIILAFPQEASKS